MPDLSKILLLDMDFLFFPILYSNSMPKTLYPKPTTNLSQISKIRQSFINKLALFKALT